VLGKGCRSRGYVRIYLDGIEISNDRADRAGTFVHYVEIPVSADTGEHSLKAGCNGYRLGTVKIIVRRARFNVTPRTVDPGDSITGLLAVVVEDGVAPRGRLGRRRAGTASAPSRAAVATATRTSWRTVIAPGRCSLLLPRQERAIRQAAASRKPAKRPTPPL